MPKTIKPAGFTVPGGHTRPWLYDPATVAPGQSVIRPDARHFDLEGTLARYFEALDHVPQLSLTAAQHKQVASWCTYGRHTVGRLQFLCGDTGLSLTDAPGRTWTISRTVNTITG